MTFVSLIKKTAPGKDPEVLVVVKEKRVIKEVERVDTIFAKEYIFRKAERYASVETKLLITGSVVMQPEIKLNPKKKWVEVSAGPIISADASIPLDAFQLSIGAGSGMFGGRINYRWDTREVTPQLVFRKTF